MIGFLLAILRKNLCYDGHLFDFLRSTHVEHNTLTHNTQNKAIIHYFDTK